MLPVGESVSNGWRRKVVFLRGVGEDVMLMLNLMSSISWSNRIW